MMHLGDRCVFIAYALPLLVALPGPAADLSADGARLFPSGLPGREWVQFRAAGFSRPVSGVVYRLEDPVTNGMPLGGVDTGCLDFESNGLLGYSTIFNSHVPRGGPISRRGNRAPATCPAGSKARDGARTICPREGSPATRPRC